MPVGTHTHDSPSSGNSAAAVYSNRTIQTNVPSTLPSGYAGTYDAVDLKDWPTKGIVTTNTLEDLRKGTNQLAKDFNDAIVNHQLQLTRNDNDITIIDTNLTEIQDDLRNIAVDLSNKAFDTILINAGTGLSGGGNLQDDRTIDLQIAANAEIGGVKSANTNTEGHIFVESNGFMTIRNDAVTLGAKTNGPYVKTIEDSGSSDIVVTDVGAETAIAKLGLTDTLTSAQTDFLGGVSGNTVTLPRIKFSKKGRITAKGTQTFQSANNPTITFESDAGGDIDITNPTITLNQTGTQSVKINHADTSTLNGAQSVGGINDSPGAGGTRDETEALGGDGNRGTHHRRVKILDSITVDDRGHVTAVTTRPITYGLNTALGGTDGSAYADGGEYDLHVPTEKDFQSLRTEFFDLKGDAITISSNENTTTVIDRPVEVGKKLTVSDDLAVDGDTLFVDSSLDKVGINLGMTGSTQNTPTVELDVSGAGKFTGALEIGGGLYINDQILHTGESGNNTSIGFPANDTFTITTGGQERLRVVGGTSDTVKVGIGTTSPTGALHVSNVGESRIDIEDTDGTDSQKFRIFVRKSDDTFAIYDGTNTRTWFRYNANSSIANQKLILLENNGNVGIGTTSPGDTLDVNGTVNISDTLDVGGAFDVTGDTTLSTTTISGSLDVDNLKLDGNTISSTNSNGDIILDPAGTGFIQVIGTNAIVIPVGNSSQRQLEQSGAIRYNSETQQFEGYAENSWASLGGVRSVDGLTFISAEDSPGGSDDIIHFHAATGNTTTNEVAQLDDVSFRILNNTTSTNQTSGALVVTGGAGVGGDLNVGGNISLGGDINLGGQLISSTFTSSGGNFTVDNSGNIGVAGVLSVASKIQHTGDTNTFLEFPSNDVFRIVTNNNERLRVASDGTVGIGTTNPLSKLDVRGNILATDGTNFGQLMDNGSLELRRSGGAFIDFSTSSGENRDCRIFQTTTEANGLGFQTGGNDNPTTKMVIEASGNVGIGIDNPSVKLHVQAADSVEAFKVVNSAGRGLFIETPTGNDNPVVYNTGNKHEFQTDGNTKLTIADNDITSTIGITTPTLTIETSGNNLLNLNTTGSDAARINSNKGLQLHADHDANSGDSQSNLDLCTEGSIKLRVKADGDVGIGYTSPSHKLDVNGTIAANADFLSNAVGTNSDPGGNKARFNGYGIMTSRGGPLYINNANAGGSISFGIGGIFNATGANKMSINSDGNVNIGTSGSTGNRLSVSGGNILLSHTASSAILNTHTTGGTVTLRHGTSYGLVGTTSNTKFTIRTNNTDKITVLANGAVGIGTSDPGSKLEVNGTAQANNLVSNGKLTIKTNGAHIALNASGSSTELADIEMDNSNGLQISCTTSTAAGKKIRLRPDNTDSFISYATYNDSVVATRASQINSRSTSGSITISGGSSSGNGAHIILHGGSHSSNGSRAFHDASRHTFRVQDGSPEIMRLEESSATLPAITQAEINSAGDHAITTKEYVDDKVSTAVSNIDVPTFSYNSSNKTLTITT